MSDGLLRLLLMFIGGLLLAMADAPSWAISFGIYVSYLLAWVITLQIKEAE